MEKLKSSTAMSKFCCITNLISFMMKEADNLMKGSVHEDDFFNRPRCFNVNDSKGNNQLEDK